MSINFIFQVSSSMSINFHLKIDEQTKFSKQIVYKNARQYR